jgi:phosphopantetheine--protein transferase-like protein
MRLPFAYSVHSEPVDERPKAQYLCDRENKRWRDIRSPKRRREWLSGRVAAKKAVQRWIEDKTTRPSLSAITIDTGTNGAPLCIEHPEVWVSISHSHENAVAVAARNPVGIDIERISNMDTVLLRWFFTPNERGWINSEHHLTDRQKLMADAWTAKEAVSKLQLKGGRIDFMQIDTVTRQLVGNREPYCRIQVKTVRSSAYAVSIAYFQEFSDGPR